MPGLVPGIYVFDLTTRKRCHSRAEPGHDGDAKAPRIALIPRFHADTVPRA